jgi:hypothetical protein
VLVLAACSACASAPERSTSGSEEDDVVSGFLATRYRGRKAGSDDDHDLTQTLLLDVHDPEGRWDASVLARANLDLDGRDRDEDADFFGLSDTYGQSLEAWLTHAYVDLVRPDWELVRLGRQPYYEAAFPLLFDGLRAERRLPGPGDLLLGGFAGLGEHPYESSSAGDTVLGAYGAVVGWEGSELRLDWMRLEDRRLGIDHTSDLVAVSASQELRRTETVTRLEGRFTGLEGDGRDLRLSASRVDARHDLSVQGSYFELLRTQNELAAPLDPFSDALFALEPYRQVTVSAQKNWDELALLVGGDLRRVSEADESPYNHDVGRAWATLSLPEIERVRVALTGERWNATGIDLESWGIDLERPLPADLSLALGSHYALFSQDLLIGEERERVRTTSLDLRWRPGEHRRWALRYELERNDVDDYHLLRLELTWLF